MRFCFEKKDFIDQHINQNQLAIIDSKRELTWNQFEQEVNIFCNYLIENNWDKLAKPVIIYGHKQAEMIIAIYALMKLKIAYIPIDVIFPEQRILAIQNIVGIEFVINCTDNNLNLTNTTEIQFQSNTISAKNTSNNLSVKTEIAKDPLIYIIFTSGSTGEPKGVQITTEAIQTFTKWMATDFGFTPKDVFINIAILSFDLSVFELMTFGAIGSTILLNEKTVSENPEKLMSQIEKHKGSIWVSTPSFALTYSRIGCDPKLKSINYFLFCGETLPHTLAKSLHSNFTQAKIYNTYGPTEATVATTKVEITKEILANYNPLPVGFPKPESQILIEKDEIVIIGNNVSIGYLNRPELNKDKFALINNVRSYKTGDNGFIKDNMLFFSARTDNQIKLHGFRIELDEITSKINDIEIVLQAETLALKRNGEVKKIVCLIQLTPSIKDLLHSKQHITDTLAKSLPHYMIPSDFKFIDKIPLNQNGKADKKELENIYLND